MGIESDQEILSMIGSDENIAHEIEPSLEEAFQLKVTVKTRIDFFTKSSFRLYRWVDSSFKNKGRNKEAENSKGSKIELGRCSRYPISNSSIPYTNVELFILSEIDILVLYAKTVNNGKKESLIIV